MLLLLLASTLSLAQDPAPGLKPPLPGAEGGRGGAGAASGGVPVGARGPGPGGPLPAAPAGGAPGASAGAPTAGVANVRQAILRVDAPGAKVVELTVEGGGGEPLVATLNDEGKAPDMRAGDSEFSGEGLLPADEVTVSVRVDGARLDGGRVAWEPTQSLRLLEVKVTDGAATATASVGTRTERTTGSTEGGAPRAGAGPTAGARPTPGPGGPPGGPGKPPEGESNLLFPAAVLVGLVAAGALVGLLPRRGGPGTPGALVAVPPGGVLGPGTPGLEDGARVWGVSVEDRATLLGLLLDALAPGREVVVALPEDAPLPTPRGPGVFRSAATPRAVLSAAAALARPGRPTVVLVVPPAGQAAAGWPDRAPGCAIMVVAAPVSSGTDVTVQREGAGLRIRSRQGDVVVAVGGGGA